MIHLFIGHEPREEAGTHVFVSSVLEHTKAPIAITPLHLPMFRDFYGQGSRDGTNAFIYTRFLVPFLMGYRGWAIFADGADMLCKADLAELWRLQDASRAVLCVQHDYATKHKRKYRGTAMEADNRDYRCKNWSSLMLMNCSHGAWKGLTPEKIEQMTGAELHAFSWMRSEAIGELPQEWNWLADEYGENPDAKLLHWTAGVPAFPLYSHAPHCLEYLRQMRRVAHVTI